MEKRIFLAVVLSFAFLLLWSQIAPRLFPELAPKTSTASPASATATGSAPKTTTTATKSAAAPALPEKPAVPVPVTPVSAEEQVVTTIDTADFVVQFSNRGAEMVSLRLKHYRAKDGSLVELVKHRERTRTDYPFAIEATNGALAARLNSALFALNDRVDGKNRVLEYRYAGADGVAATKTFTLDGEYLFKFAASVSPATPYRVAIGPGIRALDADEKESQFNVLGNAVVQRDDKLDVISREKGDKVDLFSGVQYIGIEDNYFLAVLQPQKSGGAVIHAVDMSTANEKHRELVAALNAAGDGTLAGNAFFGPKQTAILDRYGFANTLQFGYFGLIARLLLQALIWINKFTKNYGFAIIILTILIKIVLFPLQQKSMSSMKKMQKLQPRVEQIKGRYKKSKTDPEQRQKMNMEVMQLYQKEGVNPMGGCLPMILQLPILWGFYGLLSRAIELRGEPFIFWIHDLSAKDPYYITPILMMITMFIQQQMMPTTADPAQRRTFMIMPLVFGFIFKEFPSGLVLYWLVQNVLTIVQQMIMNKWWKDHPNENGAAK